MKKNQNILVAIDFSDYSVCTLDYAAETARTLESKLFIVNVINQRDVDMMENALNKLKNLHKLNSLEEWIQGVKEERKKELEKLEKSIDISNVQYTFVIKIGHPFEELLKVVKEDKIDLVIIGAKGRSDLADLLVGSTASRMFRKCPVPLVTVRSKKKSELI